jgi:hypothetical protein
MAKKGKMWKVRSAHSRTWNMARNLKNETHTLEALEYGKNTEICGK